MKTLSALPVLLLMASCSLMPATKIFVSANGDDQHTGAESRPLRTIEAAQAAVRAARIDHPGRSVRVMLGEGTWVTGRALSFGPEDGGTDGSSVVWEGKPDGRTILSGGKRISGFRDEGYGLWWAPVDSGFVFEQLYVNGQQAVRSRMPNAGDSLPRFYIDQATRIFGPDSVVQDILMPVRDRGMFANLMPQGEFEVVVFKEWTISRFKVTAMDAAPVGLHLHPSSQLFAGNYISILAKVANTYSCYLEGDPAFLDQPGEWALDRSSSRLYYKPLPGQEPGTTDIIAPLAEQLVSIAGTRESPVSNLEFRDIRFEHVAYRLPEYGHDGTQAAFFFTGNVGEMTSRGLITPGIELAWARNCRLTGCTITHAGGNGIYLREGCDGNRLESVIIENIGANGLMIGVPVDPGADSLRLPVNNVMSGGTIHNAGVAFHGAVGVWLGFCAGNEVSGCEVYDLPYTGISVGWQWNPLPTSSRNNRIINNRIHHAMQSLGDGGGIYTLGYQPGSEISGNEIHDILRSDLNHASPNNGMFIDEGSKGYRIENNTISNTAHTCIRGHRAAGVDLVGNKFYTSGLPAISHSPPYHAMIFADSDTTISWPNPGWPKEWGYSDTVVAFTMSRNSYFRK
jgi:parallel beta-helix repeat protein